MLTIREQGKMRLNAPANKVAIPWMLGAYQHMLRLYGRWEYNSPESRMFDHALQIMTPQLALPNYAKDETR